MLTQKLFLYPVPSNSAIGRSQFSIKDRKTGTVTPTPKNFATGAFKFLSASANSNNTKLLFGLDEMVDNPLYKEKTAPTQYKEVVPEEKITLQQWLEIKFVVPFGTYTEMKSSKKMDPNAKLTLLEEFFLALEDRSYVFTADTIEGCLAIQMLKNHKMVAPSKSEINPTHHLFYIGQEFEEMEQESARRQRRFEAIAGLQDLKAKRTPFLIYQVAVVMGLLKSLDTNDNAAVLNLETKFDEGSKEHIESFLELYELSKSEAGNKKIYVEYLIQAAIQTDIITTRTGTFIWNTRSKDEPAYNLGRKRSEVVDAFLKDYNNKHAAKDFNFYNTLHDELNAKRIRLNP